MKYFPSSLLIALKFLFSYDKKRNFSKIINFSIFGISIGIIIFLIGFSILNGLKKELNDKILNIIPHIEIEISNEKKYNWKNLIKKIKNINNIISVQPYISIDGILENNLNIEFIKIKCIDFPKKYKKNDIFNFIENYNNNYIKSEKPYIIIGNKLANKLNIKKNSYITLFLSKENITKFAIKKMYVNDFFISNTYLDNNIVLIPLKISKKYLNIYHINGLSIKIKNAFLVKDFIEKINLFIKPNMKIDTWENKYGYIYNDINIIKTIIYLSSFLMLIISISNIIIISIITIKNKKNDIAILKIMGAKNEFIQKIFLWYNLSINIIGISLGVFISIILIPNLQKIIKFIENIIGIKFLSKNIYFIDYIPIQFNYLDIIKVILYVFILNILSIYFTIIYLNKINISTILKKK